MLKSHHIGVLLHVSDGQVLKGMPLNAVALAWDLYNALRLGHETVQLPPLHKIVCTGTPASAGQDALWHDKALLLHSALF